MKVNSEIFRAYDIRGIVDEALTEEGISHIGKAIGSQYPC
jgi:phosphomannomutase/phosphoglucomutase